MPGNPGGSRTRRHADCNRTKWRDSYRGPDGVSVLLMRWKASTANAESRALPASASAAPARRRSDGEAVSRMRARVRCGLKGRCSRGNPAEAQASSTRRARPPRLPASSTTPAQSARGASRLGKPPTSCSAIRKGTAPSPAAVRAAARSGTREASTLPRKLEGDVEGLRRDGPHAGHIGVAQSADDLRQRSPDLRWERHRHEESKLLRPP